MGYCIQHVSSNFVIRIDQEDDALAAIKRLMYDEDKEHHGGGGGRVWFSWMNNAQPETWETLDAAFEDWRYPLVRDEAGEICGIQFWGEKIGQELEMFKAVAPFVEKGSFIEMSGEDGAMWRWTFDGLMCHEVYPEVEWPSR